MFLQLSKGNLIKSALSLKKTKNEIIIAFTELRINGLDVKKSANIAGDLNAIYA